MGNQLVISYFTENGVHGGGLWLVGSILFFNNYFKQFFFFYIKTISLIFKI